MKAKEQKAVAKGAGPSRDKAMDWTHLERQGGRAGSVAEEGAHVAGERLAAAPSAPRLPTAPRAVEIGCRACRGGGTHCQLLGSLPAWGRGLPLLYFISLFYKLRTWNAKPPFIPSGSYEGATGEDNNI